MPGNGVGLVSSPAGGSRRSPAATAPRGGASPRGHREHGGGEPECGTTGACPADESAGLRHRRPSLVRLGAPSAPGHGKPPFDRLAREAGPHPGRRRSDQVRRCRRADGPHEAAQRVEFTAAGTAGPQVLPHPRSRLVEHAARQGELGQVRRIQMPRHRSPVTGRRARGPRGPGRTAAPRVLPALPALPAPCRPTPGVTQSFVMERPAISTRPVISDVLSCRLGAGPEDPTPRSRAGRRPDAAGRTARPSSEGAAIPRLRRRNGASCGHPARR